MISPRTSSAMLAFLVAVIAIAMPMSTFAASRDCGSDFDVSSILGKTVGAGELISFEQVKLMYEDDGWSDAIVRYNSTDESQLSVLQDTLDGDFLFIWEAIDGLPDFVRREEQQSTQRSVQGIRNDEDDHDDEDDDEYDDDEDEDQDDDEDEDEYEDDDEDDDEYEDEDEDEYLKGDLCTWTEMKLMCADTDDKYEGCAHASVSVSHCETTIL